MGDRLGTLDAVGFSFFNFPSFTMLHIVRKISLLYEIFGKLQLNTILSLILIILKLVPETRFTNSMLHSFSLTSPAWSSG